MAELIGKSIVQYRNIEKGKTRSNWVTIAKICLVLNLDVSLVIDTYIRPEINGAGEFLGVTDWTWRLKVKAAFLVDWRLGAGCQFLYFVRRQYDSFVSKSCCISCCIMLWNCILGYKLSAFVSKLRIEQIKEIRVVMRFCTTTRIISLFCLVRLKGFEPPTLWFVAKYSIQLSYRRVLFS